MEKDSLGVQLKEILGIIASNSKGKERLQAQAVLMDFELIDIKKSATERLTQIIPNALTEEQYEIIKDSYQSIKAEYIKILNILGGESK